jgi:hypothetical protein
MSTTSTSTWPQQLRLPGQAAAPDGPIDMLMMYVMHHAFRRDLDAFVAAAKATPSSDRETWTALGARWERFAAILHHHHSGEDAVLWPALMARTDEAGRRTLQAMEDEHDEIDPLLQSCAEGFIQLANHDDDDARAALAVRLTATRERLARHLEHEEIDAIEMVQALLTVEDWAPILKSFSEDMTLRKLAFEIPWAAQGIPKDRLPAVFAATGKPFQVIWWITRGRFERGERRAFRYVA